MPFGGEPISDELLVFESYEQMASRPRFREAIDPAQMKPVKIIGVYNFPTKCRCGLGIHMHNKGYLTVTDSGVETNIGRHCGKKLFGVEFEMLAHHADLRDRMQGLKGQIRTTQVAVPQLLSRVNKMKDRERGGKWLQHRMQILSRAVPRGIYQHLRKRADSGAVDVFEERELTGEQRAIREVFAKTREEEKAVHGVRSLFHERRAGAGVTRIVS
jgi:hypothetical protein